MSTGICCGWSELEAFAQRQFGDFACDPAKRRTVPAAEPWPGQQEQHEQRQAAHQEIGAEERHCPR